MVGSKREKEDIPLFQHIFSFNVRIWHKQSILTDVSLNMTNLINETMV